MLAQASLGLLLLERHEQERRAELSSGEDNTFLGGRGGEGAIIVICWTDMLNTYDMFAIYKKHHKVSLWIKVYQTRYSIKYEVI